MLASWFIVLCLGVVFLCEPVWGAKDWREHAFRLTGESDRVRKKAIRALKAFPNLSTLLGASLSGPDKFLALDVISTLKLQTLLPVLRKHAPRDETGAMWLAINSLSNAENIQDISDFYRKALFSQPSPSVPSQVVVLDTLGRLGVQLSPQAVKSIWHRSAYDVRSSVLYYVRLITRRYEQELLLFVVEEALKDKAFPLRLQALHLYADINPTLQASLRPVLNRCLTDTNLEVRTYCQNLNEAQKK